MSLRTDVHDAIDEVAPPAPMLTSQVQAFVLTASKESRAASGSRVWMVRWGEGAAAMVAAVLIVVLVAAVLVGGRLWRDWNAFQYRQAVGAELAPLEARPLLSLPSVGPGDPCPAGPYNQFQYLYWLGQPQAAANANVFGDGPAYQWEPDLPSSAIPTDWGTWIETNFLAAPGSSGLLLLRARDLQTNQTVVFAENPYADQSRNDGFTTGDVVGHDIYVDLAVQAQPMLVIDASPNSEAVPKHVWRSNQYFQVSVLVGYPKGSSDCIAFQVDGPGFTELFVVSH